MGRRRGDGVLSGEQEAEARELYEDGESARLVALHFGVTKNTIAGLAHRHDWIPGNDAPWRKTRATLFDRMNALEAMFVEVLRLYPPGTGLLPPPPPAPRKPRAKDWAHR